MLAEPESLDPQMITGSTDFDVVEDLFEGLTAQGADGAVIPGLAQSWSADQDGLVWTFHLRPDLVWSNGNRLTAGDFVWAMRRAVDPTTASPYAAALDPIRNAAEITRGSRPVDTLGVTAPDDRTVRITLREPTPFLAGVLAQPVTYPLPKATIDRWNKQWSRPEHMISDGAFVLGSWTPQDEIVLERNPKYHEPPGDRVQTVRWILADDRRAGLRRYRANELDTAALGAEDYRWAASALPQELHSTPLLASRYLIVNMARQPLGDTPAMRQALSMAIDRDLLVSKIDTRGQIAAWGLVPPGMKSYPPQRLGYAADSEPAREHAASALFPRSPAVPQPVQITLLVEHDDVDHRIAQAIAAMWQAALPVKVTLEEHEWRVFNAQLHAGNFQVALFGWYADYADPWNFLANLKSDARELNMGAYRDQIFDGMLDASRTAAPEARMQLLGKAEAQMLANHPIIPLEYVVSQKLVKPGITGWAADPFDMNLDKFLSVGPS